MQDKEESEDALEQVQELQHQLQEVLEGLYVETTQRKERPDWGLNPGPSGTALGALTTELPGLGYT